MKKKTLSAIILAIFFALAIYGYDYSNNNVAEISKYLFQGLVFGLGIFIFDFITSRGKTK